MRAGGVQSRPGVEMEQRQDVLMRDRVLTMHILLFLINFVLAGTVYLNLATGYGKNHPAWRDRFHNFTATPSLSVLGMACVWLKVADFDRATGKTEGGARPVCSYTTTLVYCFSSASVT